MVKAHSSKRLHSRKLPLVYACSGCSSAAQAANYIALKLDRDGDAEMSCISGVGGNVQHLVNIARSGRPILALDGCPLACTIHCLAQRGISADYHLQLHKLGVKKKYHSDFDLEQANRIAADVALLANKLADKTFIVDPEETG
jgi:uncharacterized metal-binding protein